MRTAVGACASVMAVAGLGLAAPLSGAAKLCCKVEYRGKATVLVTGTATMPRDATFLYAPGCKAKAGVARVAVELKRKRSDFERGYHVIDYVYRSKGEVHYETSPRFFVRGTAKPAGGAS